MVLSRNVSTILAVSSICFPIRISSSYLSKVMGLGFIGFICLIFVWCYVSPLLRKKRIFAALRRKSSESIIAEEWPSLILNDYEKKTLVSWLRRCSRGRFADTDLKLLRVITPPELNRKLEHKTSGPWAAFFPSGSPYLAPLTPPPKYASPDKALAPNPRSASSPIPYPFALDSEIHIAQPLPALSVPRMFLPHRRIVLRSASVPAAPIEEKQSYQRSVSDSRVQPSTYVPLPSPSRAMVVYRENISWKRPNTSGVDAEFSHY